MTKVFDRIGYLEDALSRVELQQDSMRPVLKMIESNHHKSGTSSSMLISKKLQNKENSSNTSSFLS